METNERQKPSNQNMESSPEGLNQGPAADHSRRVIALLVLLTVAQIALTLAGFRTRQDLLNDQPIVNVDFSSQYYWAHAAREFHRRQGRLWGYDPWFMAGYPLDFISNSSLPLQMMAVAFPGQPLGRLIKILFILSFALVPLILYAGLIQFGLRPWPALAAAGLGLVHFWLAEPSLFGRWGMISGAFLLSFSFLTLGLLLRYLRERGTGTLAALAAALALALTIHKTALMLVFAPALIWIALDARRLKLRDFLGLVAALAVTALVNRHWLGPFLRFLPLKVEDSATDFFQNTDLLRWIKDLVPIQAFFGIPLCRLLMIGLGVIGLIKLRRERSSLFWPLAAGLAFFGTFSYFGSLVPLLRHLQPYRYVSEYFYLWLPAAGVGLGSVKERLAGRPRLQRASPLLFSLLLLALLLMPGFQYFSLVAPLRTDLDRDSQDLVAWVKARTDPSARIMIEDINAWEGKQGVYGGARLPHLLPLLCRRELIGGPLPNAFILHHYASFQDGRLLNRPVSAFRDRDLAEVLDRYNVGWVVCWSEAAKARFQAYPAAGVREDFGTLAVFTLARPHNFFLAGQGGVKADFDSLELSDLATANGRVVVSYHWVDGLRSEPPAKLVKVPAGDDPAGFIGIQDPPASLRIWLGP